MYRGSLSARRGMCVVGGRVDTHDLRSENPSQVV